MNSFFTGKEKDSLLIRFSEENNSFFRKMPQILRIERFELLLQKVFAKEHFQNLYNKFWLLQFKINIQLSLSRRKVKRNSSTCFISRGHNLFSKDFSYLAQ